MEMSDEADLSQASTIVWHLFLYSVICWVFFYYYYFAASITNVRILHGVDDSFLATWLFCMTFSKELLQAASMRTVFWEFSVESSSL